MNKSKVAAVLLILTTLSGCSTMTPKYSQPTPPIPTKWKETANSQLAVKKEEPKVVADILWRDFFADEKLQKIIALALDNNRDLRVAALNIEKLRALYQIHDYDLLPKVDATAAATFQRLPETLSGSGKSKNTEQYSVGVGITSYELDLFGRVRSLKDQALEQFFASEHSKRALQITLVSQVAASYLNLAADIERLKLSKETLANQQESYKLTKSRFDNGVSNSLALNQAKSTVDAALVEIARYSTLVTQDENSLNFIVGSTVPAEFLPHTLSESMTSTKDIYYGQSSDILLNRPDILQAESQLKGLNANIGFARAAFFPKITLVSSIGVGSDELSSLFKGGAFAWSFAPRISLPIFDGGSNKANLKVAEVERDIAVAQYEKAIQNAFREVADAVALSGTVDEQLAAQQSLVNSTAESLRFSQARFDKGVDSYLVVLDSQRNLYAAEQAMIGTRLLRLTNILNLYKAMGGGK